MFYQCVKLPTIPQLDTSSGTDFESMFLGCTDLTTIPQLNTSNGTSFYQMFRGCTALTTIPQLDTSSGTDFNYMFRDCTALTSIEGIDFSSVSSFNKNTFQNCSALTSLKINGSIKKACDFSQAPNLDLASLTSICEALEAKTSGSFYCTLTKAQYNSLSSSTITMVTNKGWGFKTV